MPFYELDAKLRIGGTVLLGLVGQELESGATVDIREEYYHGEFVGEFAKIQGRCCSKYVFWDYTRSDRPLEVVIGKEINRSSMRGHLRFLQEFHALGRVILFGKVLPIRA